MIPFKPGTIHVTCDEPETGFHARRLLEAHAAQGSSDLGLPFPSTGAVVSLQTGTERDFEQAQILRRLGLPSSKADVEYRHAGREGFNFLREEGITVLLNALSAPAAGWIAFEQRFDHPLPEHVIEGLTRAKHEAIAASKHIMLFSPACSPALLQQLGRLVDEIIEIETCEPEPSARISFCVRWSGARYMGDLGLGPVMVSAQLQNGGYHYRGAPFVSKDVAGRVMWRLRGAGWTLQAIAELFRMNRSTVKRRLDQMPPVRPKELPEGWLDRYRDCLDISAGDDI
ncbi:hypothetical protein J2W25_004602 [Variovorax boronicumulans]|uniref:Uncharacterized protein n=1 Tax=Variovorax boronicumulans TaxID=436515 RepID=A0AAW8E2K9_9BURK|nr:hypothetical protein [Variovorax boronicumulans]MDP9880274.1 hypothetical protein [Variovorax boronicumulans]MDP9925559.1 hypothetical protein [Variovorax boronicumulans]